MVVKRKGEIKFKRCINIYQQQIVHSKHEKKLKEKKRRFEKKRFIRGKQTNFIDKNL